MRLRRLIALVAGLPILAVAALGAVSYYSATRDPVIARYTVGLRDWPAGAPPLRIVQLSDIHFGVPDMPAARVDAIVAQANALKPDLIALTGDYHGGKLWDLDSGNMDVAVRPLKALRARYGVVAVRGNHDGPYWTPRVFGRTHIQLLQNRWLTAGPATIAGVDDLTTPTHPSIMARMAVAGAPPGVPLILLAHEPDFFAYVPARVDLMIAGHTHGGQIVLPLIGPVRGLDDYLKAHRRGWFREHGQQLIVSSGIGTSVVPLRIGVPPEMVLITVGPVIP